MSGVTNGEQEALDDGVGTLEEVSLQDTPLSRNSFTPESPAKGTNGNLHSPVSPRSVNGNRPPPLNGTSNVLPNVQAVPMSPPPRVSTSTQDATTRRGSSTTSLTLGKGQQLSTVLITSALDTIAASKEAKKSQPLREAVEHALDMLKQGQGADRPRDIFEPLRLACETKNEKLMVASLDCISKLISYSFFAEANPSSQPYSSPPGSPSASTTGVNSSLADLVTHTITSCYTESTPDTVSLQIVKALLSTVLSPHVLVHHSSLLKAVRTVYNIFLLSQDPMNQNVAQGGLTQMVNHIFARCQVPADAPGASELPFNASRSSLVPSAKDLDEASLTPPTSTHDIPRIESNASLDQILEVAQSIPLPDGDLDENGASDHQKCVIVSVYLYYV